MNNGRNELKELILVLKKRIKEKDVKICKIKRPKFLLGALIELDEMIGMERLKNSIALQIMTLIEELNMGEKNMSMLNTILYGPPGVGKSKVGVILSKIWYGLGFLKEPNNREEFSYEGIPSANNINPGIVIFVAFIVLLYLYGTTMASVVYNNYGGYWLIAFVAILIVFAVILYWFSVVKTKTINSTKVNESNDDKGTGNIITVVSRQDFVAGYVGQTATKTKALLTKNLGKVLFIDEAYSLINDSRDSFGHEALDTLILFMSEHPNEIVVIFAGYKEKLKNSIFKAQDGLPRRCMWHFECDGYNGDELCSIFLKQTEKDGWKLLDKRAIFDIIKDNEKIFTSYGGDTERLLFFAKLQASRNNFFDNNNQSRTLTPDDIKTGIVQLLQNNITSDDHDHNSDKSKLQKIIEKLQDDNYTLSDSS